MEGPYVGVSWKSSAPSSNLKLMRYGGYSESSGSALLDCLIDEILGESPSKFLVYAMFDPRNGRLRYIGKSCHGLKRPRSQLGRVRRGYEGRGHKVNWLKTLDSLHLQPCIAILQELPSAEGLAKAERWWIAYFRSMGCPLTNLTDGGEGAWGRVNSPETKLKMSISARTKRYNKKAPLDYDAIAKDYLSGLSMRKVAEKHETSSSMVCKTLQKMGIPLRSKSAARLMWRA